MDADDEGQSEDVITLLQELRQGQRQLRASIDSKIDKMKNDIIQEMNNRMVSLREDLLSEVERIDKKLEELERRLQAVEGRRHTIIDEENNTEGNNTQPRNDDQSLKQLQYRTLDLEARSRRNNVLVFNLKEEEHEDIGEVFESFIRNQLKVASNVVVQRVHRLGYNKREGKHRPVIACLRDYADIELLFKNANKLKGTKYGLSRDYPEAIRKARDRLGRERREAVQAKKRAVIAYPAKLIVDGTVVRDEFPDWKNILHMDNTK